jgi:hypothetical protein
MRSDFTHWDLDYIVAQPDILKGPYCNAAIFIIDISTKAFAKRGRPLFQRSNAAGPV